MNHILEKVLNKNNINDFFYGLKIFDLPSFEKLV